MFLDFPDKRFPRVARLQMVKAAVGRYGKFLNGIFYAANHIIGQGLVVLFSSGLGVKQDNSRRPHLSNGIRVFRVLVKVALVPIISHVDAALVDNV
jgi:hypothetical protein